MGYPTPQEVQAAGVPIEHYTSKAKFEEYGGFTHRRQPGMRDRFSVSAAPATYNDVDSPIEAMDLFWALFNEEGGWTVFVWDHQMDEGWAYTYVGPEWYKYLRESMGLAPETAAPAASGQDPGLLARVNQYRGRFSHPPLQPGEWSDADLEEFIRNVRSPNGRKLADLKHRLT